MGKLHKIKKYMNEHSGYFEIKKDGHGIFVHKDSKGSFKCSNTLSNSYKNFVKSFYKNFHGEKLREIEEKIQIIRDKEIAKNSPATVNPFREMYYNGEISQKDYISLTNLYLEKPDVAKAIVAMVTNYGADPTGNVCIEKDQLVSV